MTQDEGTPATTPETAVTRTDEVAAIVAAIRTAHAPSAPAPSSPEQLSTPVRVAVVPAPKAVRPVPPPPAVPVPARVREGGSAVHLGPAPVTGAQPVVPAPAPSGPQVTGGHAVVVDVTADGARVNGMPLPSPAGDEARVVGPTGRLRRGPARRTRVFDRDIWRGSARSARDARDLTEALTEAVHRYRQGAIDTTGLVRAIGHALAA